MVDPNSKTLKDLDEIIREYGVNSILHLWKVKRLTPAREKFIDKMSDAEFVLYVNDLLKTYHPRSYIVLKTEKIIIELPKVSIQYNENDVVFSIIKHDHTTGIPHDQMFHTYTNPDYIRQEVNIVSDVFNALRQLRGRKIVIDLTEYHSTGSIIPILKAFIFLRESSLMACNKVPINFNQPHWMQFNGTELTYGNYVKYKSIDVEIDVLISNNTYGSGEFIAAMFKGRDKCTLISPKNQNGLTGGGLSLTDEIEADHHVIGYAAYFVTTVDGIYHGDERLQSDRVGEFVK